MKKIIFTDLDETLLVNHHVPEENREIIKRAQEKGVKVVPCTGRPYNIVTDITKEMGISGKDGEYAICFNGGLIMELGKEEIVDFKRMDFNLVKPVFENGIRNNLCVLIFTLDKVYMWNTLESELIRKKDQKAPLIIMEDTDTDIDFLKDELIAKILYVNEDKEVLDYAISFLTDEFLNEITLTFSSSRYAEFNDYGINKGAAIRELCRILNVDIEDTLGVGDNYNDVEMIKAAGTGVYMANTPPELAVHGDYVTKKRYDEGGFVEMMEKFVFND